jgi:hypothetical protein
MFGLYPAGPDWVRHFTASISAREIQQLLVKHAAFTAGLFHQPYGRARGAVIALRRGFLVMTEDIDAVEPELVVAPDVELTNLLWSHSSGYASQWSPRELKALTRCESWQALLGESGGWFSEACSALERAIDGSLVSPTSVPVPVAARAPADPGIGASLGDDDVPWLPSDYLHDVLPVEGFQCDR